MKAIDSKEIQNWVLENYRFYDGPTSISMDFDDSNTICSLEIEWLPAKRNAHPKIKVRFTGVFDETFYPIAKVHLDAQFLDKLENLAPSFSSKFLHLLN